MPHCHNIIPLAEPTLPAMHDRSIFMLKRRIAILSALLILPLVLAHVAMH